MTTIWTIGLERRENGRYKLKNVWEEVRRTYEHKTRTKMACHKIPITKMAYLYFTQ